MKFNILYLWAKLLKKMRSSALYGSNINSLAAIGSGSSFYFSSIDKYSFCGYNCEIYRANIGCFTSIANCVIIGGARHPMEWGSMSPVFYSGRDSVPRKFSEFSLVDVPETNIGHDVWIGHSVIIISGVVVGNGAVIGAGSVVTRDVPPYSVVVGNPARIVKYRFDDQTVDRFQKSSWWDLEESVLQSLSVHVKDPIAFLDGIEMHARL